MYRRKFWCQRWFLAWRVVSTRRQAVAAVRAAEQAAVPPVAGAPAALMAQGSAVERAWAARTLAAPMVQAWVRRPVAQPPAAAWAQARELRHQMRTALTART